MFKPNTLLIIGAGASYELGFPVGLELKSEIASFFTVDPGSFPEAWQGTRKNFIEKYASIHASKPPVDFGLDMNDPVLQQVLENKAVTVARSVEF